MALIRVGKRLFFILLIVSLMIPCLNAESGIYDRIGIISEHGLHGAVPEENIDLFTGNLTLKNLDIHLTGPNGFDLNIWRVYNSKILKDRLLGSAWGIQQEPYSWVGFGWSMHMGRLHAINSETPVIEYPDGRWETAYRNINDNGTTFLTRDFAKLDKTNWELHFKDGTVWTFGALANINYGSMVIEQVRVVTQITNSYGHHIDIFYDGSGSPRMSSITDSMGRTVTFVVDAALGKLQRINVKNATGSVVSYYYTVDAFNGDYYKLTRFDPPLLPAVTYEYGDGMTSNWELLAVNTSYGGRMEYTYADHEFLYQVYPLSTKVVQQKRIKFSSSSDFKTWTYAYPSYNNVTTGTVEVTGPEYSTFATYNAYSASTPWKIGLLKEKSVSDNSSLEQYEWTAKTISNTRWYVLNIDMGQAAAPLQSRITKTITGDADSSEEYLYERATTSKYGLATQINLYANGVLKNYKELTYYFESIPSFETKYMLNHLKSEILKNSSNSKLKETTMTYFTNGAIDSITKWKSGSTYLTWNYGYTSSNPNLITITIDLPVSGGTETMVYKYGVLATLTHPTYTEYTRTISAYDSSILSETNQHGAVMGFSYDNLGRITAIDLPSGFNDVTASWATNYVTITQGGNSVIKYWDGMGRDTGYWEQGDGITLYYRKTLDSDGRTISESKGSTNSGDIYTYTYNNAGQVTKIIDPRGKITTITMAADQKTVTDANSHSAVLEYNDLPGLVTRLTDPAGKIAVLTYDGAGRLLSTTFNSSRTQSYTYNGLDQATSENHPETGAISYEYSTANNLATKTWSGALTAYTHNTSNQVLTENAGDETITYAYDSKGRVSSVSSGLGWSKNGIGYNSFGSITQETLTIPGLSAKTMSYSYSGNNQLAQITYPDGRIAAYTNNGLNLPETIAFNGSTMVNSIAYGIGKQPTTISFSANGTSYAATYNNNGGILSTNLKKSSSFLYDSTYTYDNVGNIASLSQSNPSLTASYTYDIRNRLTGASYSPSGVGRVNNFVYDYDDYCNMTQAKENGISVFYQGYSNKNQISTLSYDSHGNVISSPNYNYAWDNRNRLSQITNKLSLESEGNYAYDEKGMRLKATRPLPPAIAVTSPAAGVVWPLGSTQTITWTSSGVSGSLDVILCLPNAPSAPPVMGIAAGTANDGSENWTIPDTIAPGDYLVRIRSVSSPDVFNDSPIFKIKPIITVTSPSSYNEWCIGNTYKVTWTSSGVSGSVDVILRLAGAPDAPPVLGIAAGTTNDGSESWTIPASLAPGNYLVRIRSVSAPDAYDDSEDFLIKDCSAGAITVTNPHGETWHVGSQYSIQWESTNVPAGQLHIILRPASPPDANPVMAIAANTDNDGIEGWTIPESVPTGNYLIRIRTVSESPYIYDDSLGFAIEAEFSLKLTAPNGGEKWTPGSGQNITWSGGKDIRELKIEYSTDLGSTYQLITDRAPNTGSYAWQVPGTVSDHCLVRISDASGQAATENAVLECDLTFVLKGKETDSTEPLLALWLRKPILAGVNSQNSREAIPMLALSRSELDGGYQLNFGEYSAGLGNTASLFENPQRIKVQWDIMRGRGTLYFNQQPVFKDIPLLPLNTRTVAPCLTLQTGKAVSALQIDDFQVKLVGNEDFPTGNNSLRDSASKFEIDSAVASTSLLLDDFESYQTDENLSGGGWKISLATKDSGFQADSKRQRKATLALDALSGKQSGMITIPANTTFTLTKPISWPERVPFAVSAKPFSIIKATIPEEHKEKEFTSPDENKFEKETREENEDLNLKGPHVSVAAKTTPISAMATLYTTTFYIYSHDGKLLAEYDATGTCQKDYIYMGGKLIAEYQPVIAKYYYYASDQINSTRIITDSTGAVVYSAVFDPYGGMQKQWVNTYSPSLKFSGKERESKSEMDYFGARYYDHLKYRFLSVDPVINKEEALVNLQLWNLYAYCRNNPVTFLDPDGRDTYVVLYGQSGVSHNVGDLFKWAAETRITELSSSLGNDDKLIFKQVSTVEQFREAVNYSDLKLIEYFGHGSADALYMGDARYTDKNRTNLYGDAISVLPGKFVSGGKIKLNACNTARNGENSIAGVFADRYQVPVQGSTTPMDFSGTNNRPTHMKGDMTTIFPNLEK
jgi:RHS repeat-associated protein